MRLGNLSSCAGSNVHEAKIQLSKLLEGVEAGERVIIVRAGKPVAVLGPYKAAVRPRRLGLFAGQVTTREDFDELPPDIADAHEMTSR